jgi:FSR family fosmidomycin resistance protein-like MFS transporter
LLHAHNVNHVNGVSRTDIPLRRRLRGVGTLSVGHFVNDSYAYVLPAVLPVIVPTLGLTLGMAGSLVSLYQVLSSLIQPAVGYVADRTTLRWPAWAGVAMSGLSAGLLGLAPTYWSLLGVLVIGGIGTAIFHPVSAAMVGASAPSASRGRWLGLYVSAGSFGLAFGPLAIGALVRDGNVAAAWPIMLPGLVCAAIVAVLAPRGRTPTQRGVSLAATLRRHGHILSALLAVTGLRSWAYSALITFVPLLATQRGASLDRAAAALTAFLFTGALGGVVGGYGSDRLGRDRVIVASLLVAIPCGLYVALVDSTGLDFVVACGLCGFFLNGSFVVMTVRGQNSVPGSVGMVTGLMLGLSVGLGGVAVTPLALLAEQVGIPAAAALAICVGCGGATLAMRLLPPESKSR